MKWRFLKFFFLRKMKSQCLSPVGFYQRISYRNTSVTETEAGWYDWRLHNEKLEFMMYFSRWVIYVQN